MASYPIFYWWWWWFQSNCDAWKSYLVQLIDKWTHPFTHLTCMIHCDYVVHCSHRVHENGIKQLKLLTCIVWYSWFSWSLSRLITSPSWCMRGKMYKLRKHVRHKQVRVLIVNVTHTMVDYYYCKLFFWWTIVWTILSNILTNSDTPLIWDGLHQCINVQCTIPITMAIVHH